MPHGLRALARLTVPSIEEALGGGDNRASSLERDGNAPKRSASAAPSTRSESLAASWPATSLSPPRRSICSLREPSAWPPVCTLLPSAVSEALGAAVGVGSAKPQAPSQANQAKEAHPIRGGRFPPLG